jgi:protein SCO1/2
MQIKPYLPYIGIAAFALIVGLVAGYLNLEQRSPDISSGPTTTIVLLRPGKPLPAFRLQGTDGMPFTPASLTGHWSLLYFGYTRCPASCRATLVDLARMTAKLKALPAADRPQVYFISVDPAHDTLSGLKQFVQHFDADFAAATGPLAQLGLLTAALGVDTASPSSSQSGGDAVNHSSPLLVIDPEGKETAVFTPPLIPDRMVDDYRFILKLNGAQP